MQPVQTTSFALPKEYVEQELAEISQSNERIREEIESGRSKGAFQAIPRSVVTEQETSQSFTPPAATFGQRESSVKRMWGLEEQIKEDLEEKPSIAPLPTREPTYETTPSYSTSTTQQPQQTQFDTSQDISFAMSNLETTKEQPNVIVVSSIKYKEFTVPTDIRFKTPEVDEPTVEVYEPTKAASGQEQSYAPRLLGLKPINERTQSLKRTIDIFYDKNSMFTWNSNATVFCKWLANSKVLHEGDLVRHITFSPYFEGVLSASDFNRNEDALRRLFPDQYPFWLEYFALNIRFEIVFIKSDTQSFKNELEYYTPSLLLCPVMPDMRNPLYNTITREISKVPIMFAH